MSSTVDSRVVEMHFDNSDFMGKVKETIASLETLNDRIDALNASKGLENLAGGASGSDLNGVADAVGNIESRFSTLGIAGMTVIQRLTNAGINMATRIGGGIKSVANQIKEGGFVRAENIEQAKFLLEGLGANITSVMADVDWAVTGTAYGLDEAAKSAAIFYASGIKGSDEMRTSLRAIAGVAAMSGQSFGSIADVFQDAAGMSKITRNEILRLQQQGVAADQYLLKFINRVVESGGKVEGVSEDVSKSVMELTNGTKLSLEDLTEPHKGLLSQGAIGFNIFAAAMDDAFGKHSQDANKTFSGSLANMKTALSRLGEAFMSPTMQAAIPLFNSIQGAVKSLTNALKSQGGIVYEYTYYMKFLGESISGAIDKASELYVFAEIGRIVANGFRLLMAVTNAFKEAFKEVFPEATIENVGKIVHHLADLSSNFVTTHRNLIGLGQGFIMFFSVIKIGINIIKGVAKVFNALIDVLGSAFKSTTALRGGFAEMLETLANQTNSIGIFDFIANVINKAGQSIQKGVSFIVNGISSLIKGLANASDGVEDFTESFSLLGSAYASMFLWRRFVFGLQETFKDLAILLHPRKGVTGAFAEFTKLPQKISGTLGALTDSLKAMQYEVDSKILKNLAAAILALAIALKIISSINTEDLGKSLGAVTILLAEMGMMLKAITGFSAGAAGDSLKSLYKLGSISNAMIKIGVALILMASALKIISTLKPEELAIGLTGLTIILGSVLGFSIAVGKYAGEASKSLGAISTSMIAMGAALYIMALAVEKMSSMKSEELAKGLGSIVVLMGAIFGLSAGMSKVGSGGGAGMVAAGAGMVLMAAAINILVPALQKLGGMKLPELATGIGAVAAALIIMAGASNFMSLGGGAGFAVMALGIASLATSIQRLSEIDPKSLAISIGALAVSMGVMVAAAALASLVIPGLLALGAAMLMISSAIAILGAGLILIGGGLASIAAGIMAFASISQTAVMMFSNAVTMALQALINLLPMVAVSLAEAFVSFVEQIAELAPRLAEAATEIIHTLLEAINNNVPDIIATGLNLIISFLQGVEEAIPQISSAAAGIIAGFIEGIAEQMDAIIQAGIDLMLAFINGLANGVAENAEAIHTAIMNLCVSLLEAFCAFWGINSPSTVMEAQGVNIIQGLINGLGQNAGAVVTALVRTITKGFKGIVKFVGKFKNAGGGLVKGIIQGIKGKASGIATGIVTGIKTAVGKVTGFAGKFKTAGGDLVKGIARGIRNGASSVISATGSIAKQALNWFKRKLGIGSPSKEFAKVSRWIPEGIVVGINKTAKKVDTAMEKLSGRTVDTMSDAISGAIDKLSMNDDFNPTITPVLDLSNVEANSKRISSMLDPGTIDAAYSAASEANQNTRQMDLLNALVTKLGRLEPKDRPNVTINASVEGSENPSAFANELLRSLETHMRTA